MLEIIEFQRSHKDLCCLTSDTLLKIVSKHEIHFNYQEVAIIKKFNHALQNVDSSLTSENRFGFAPDEDTSEKLELDVKPVLPCTEQPIKENQLSEEKISLQSI